ncbi:MAG: hypothetical protein VYC17_01915 [Nitrospinota bacterium]|nr:hypothetical protein [Nitrospinota bacterium]
MTANERDNEENNKDVEDTSAYYAQGDTDEAPSTDELYKPVPEINDEDEEMNFLKAMAFLGFGLGSLSIIFILFFMHDLDERVLNMDSAVAKLDEKLVPFKKEITDNINRIGADVAQLQGKVNNYERTQAIMELKRALITVQEVASETNADVQSKSGEVVANIQVLLNSLAGKPTAPAAEEAAPSQPPAEAPAAPETPAAEPEQTAASETLAESDEPAAEESGTDVGEIELATEGDSEGEDGEGADDEEFVEDDK